MSRRNPDLNQSQVAEAVGMAADRFPRSLSRTSDRWSSR